MSGDTARRVFSTGDYPAIPAPLRGGAVAIGNFDGMHRGHQSVLEAARQAADRRGAPALVLTFEPHPRDVFHPETRVFRLTPAHVKARIAEALGLDGLVTVAFDRAFAAVPAEDFVRDVVVGALGATTVAVGWNFHFGARRGGTPERLCALGAEHGFAVDVVPAFADEGGTTVSSSRIRDLIAAGAVEAAAGLIGYRWFFEGEVVHGDKRGRTIGYPTANMRLPGEAGLAHGIYAVMIEIDGERRQGVASFGRRPTFDNGAPVFETHVFDFAGELYGRTVTVTPVCRLREEMRFDGIAALVAQMDRDSEEARAVLSALAPISPLDRALHFG